MKEFFCISELINHEFLSLLLGKEKAAWNVFMSVTSNFLGSSKAANACGLVFTTKPHAFFAFREKRVWSSCT